MSINEYLPAILLGIRNNKNLTQEQFGKICGVSRQIINNWENGRSLPDINALVTIAKTFNLSLDEMFGCTPQFIPTEQNTPYIFYLNSEEKTIINSYRNMTKTDKNFYLEIAKAKSQVKKDE